MKQDGSVERIDSLILDEAISKSIFDRTGEIAQIKVEVIVEKLR